MTNGRTVEYPVRLSSGDFAYIWAEPGTSHGDIKTLGKAMGLDIVQVSSPRRTSLH